MFPLKSDGMRGLAVFISDIRNCKSKEAEIKRINKELANIRSKFKSEKTFDGYQKKKYICKLLFIFLLGHDIDFGHMEAVNLLTSNKYSEKQIGYLFISVLMSYASDLMRLVIQSIKNDITSSNSSHVALSLQCLSNISSREMAEEFYHEVIQKLCSSESTEVVKQCSSLCLLRFLRNSPEVVNIKSWSPRLIQLLNDKDLGVVTSATSLIHALVLRSPNEYKSCIPIVVARLGRIISSPSDDLQDYTYYFVPAPWLTIKFLKLLQSFVPSDIPMKMKLSEVLERILNKSQEALKSRKVQHSNIKNAILFECINLIIHLDNDPALLVRSCAILGNFLIHRETNLRYLALETLCLLASSEYCHHVVKKHQYTVLNALKNEKDISVRQKAVDMLYAMCNKSNVAQIVLEMLTYLEVADYSMREEMVLKVAILSEKYALDYSWYVDTILHLIKVAGDYVSEEVWHRVIQVVVNREDVQGYAAKTVFEMSPCHENMVKVGGYVLGEFGNLIAGDPRSSPLVQLSLLTSKFPSCSPQTQQILLTTFVKFANLFPEIKQRILDFFKSDKLCRSSNVELQQRVVEYHRLVTVASLDVLAIILEEMPPFPEKDTSILSKLKTRPPESSENPPTSIQICPTGHARHQVVNNIPKNQKQSPPQQQKQYQHRQQQQLVQQQQQQQLVQQQQQQQLVQQQQKLVQQQLIDTSIVPYPHDVTRFLFTNIGVLFESDLIQIGVRSEFRQQLGRIALFFGNKTNDQFSNLSSRIIFTPSSQSCFRITSNPIEDILNAKTQKQQLVSVECLSDFVEAPRLHLSFRYSGREYTVNISLPILINKFIRSSEMGSQLFFTRWHNLAGLESALEKSYPLNKFPSKDKLSQKLMAFGLTCLPNIDPIDFNLASAGVLHTTSFLCGILLRLEINHQAQICKLTIRTNRNGLAHRLCDLLGPHL